MNQWFSLLILASLLNFSADACFKKCFGRPEPEEPNEIAADPTPKRHFIIIKRSEGTWKTLKREIPENSHQDWIYAIEVNKNNCITVEDKDVALLKDKVRWEHSWNIHSHATGTALLRLTLLTLESKVVEQQLINVSVID